MELDKLTKEENVLARKLRAVCTSNLDEDESKLSESTEIFFRMGCLYVQKIDLTEGMEQKLNFIKAATLLHAARVRSEKFLKNHWLHEIQDQLLKMQTLLMKYCSGKVHVPLVELSNNVLNAFEFFRQEEKEILESLEIITEDILENEAEKKRERKVEVLKNLLRRNSDNYKNQMQRIAADCLNILGPQQCNFVLVGLGSLARDEVTLYSDFEHVIILEEGVQHRQKYGKILEYFRWFSVVFHIIVIGVGETILRSIGIESINDLYSSDKSKNWFYDSFTPSGVSFDGMMPHACKIPLGRQRTTENKTHTVELIKPASQMALYLTKEEDVINEYCLKDVLCETCFVFGELSIYSQFKEMADKILAMDGENNSFSSVSKAVNDNINPYVRGHKKFLTESSAIDTKFTFYRPLSVLIGYHARSQQNGGKSGFEKISNAKDLPTSHTKKSMMWAFAVACEVRLKLYAACQGNRAKYVGGNLPKFVGKSCLVNCASAIDSMSRFLNLSSLNDARSEFYRFGGTKYAVLLSVEDFSGAREAVQDVIRHASVTGYWAGWAMKKWKYTLALIHLMETDDDLKHLKEAENILKQIENYRQHIEICRTLSMVYVAQGRNEEATKLLNHVFRLEENSSCLETLRPRGASNLYLRAPHGHTGPIKFDVKIQVKPDNSAHGIASRKKNCIQTGELAKDISFCESSFNQTQSDGEKLAGSATCDLAEKVQSTTTQRNTCGSCIAESLSDAPSSSDANREQDSRSGARQLLRGVLRNGMNPSNPQFRLKRLVAAMDACSPMQYRRTWFEDFV